MAVFSSIISTLVHASLYDTPNGAASRNKLLGLRPFCSKALIIKAWEFKLPRPHEVDTPSAPRAPPLSCRERQSIMADVVFAQAEERVARLADDKTVHQKEKDSSVHARRMTSHPFFEQCVPLLARQAKTFKLF